MFSDHVSWFDSTVVINLLINISSPKLNNQFFFKHSVHGYENVNLNT